MTSLITTVSDISKAEAFATAAHSAIDQRRKYTGDPYWVHPRNVCSLIVQHVPDYTYAQLCVAWLHDVVEDTHVTHDIIKDMFDQEISYGVFWMTDPSTLEDANRARRKELYKNHIAKAPSWVKTIKLADLIDNTYSIVEHDPNFARVYLREKRQLLEVLTEGDPILFNQAWELAHQRISE